MSSTLPVLAILALAMVLGYCDHAGGFDLYVDNTVSRLLNRRSVAIKEYLSRVAARVKTDAEKWN